MTALQSILKWSKLKSSIVTLAFLNIVLMVLLVQQVAAGTINTIPRYNFLSGVTAYAEVRSFPSELSATCSIRSYTSPSTTINVIGWTWWQCDLLVNGNVISSVNRPGSVKTGSSHQDFAQFTPPGSYHQIKSHGVHDFNHNGSNPSPWRPYNVNIYP